MIFYLTLYLLLLIFTLCSWPTENRLSKLLFYVFSLIVIIVPSVRDISVGTDTITYVKYFNNTNLGYDGHDVETTFRLWNIFISNIYKNENFYVFVTTLIPLTSIVYFINKNSPYRIMSLFLFVILNSYYSLFFSGMRQSFAIGFFLVSVNFYFKKDYLMACIFYTLTILFHSTSAYCIFIVLLFPLIPISKRTAYILIISSFTIGLFNIFDYRSSISFIFNIIEPGNSILQRYEHYSSAMDWSVSKHRVLWDMIPPSLIGMLCYKYNTINNNTKYLKLLLFGTIFSNIIVSYPIGFRLTIYFTILSIVVIPTIFTRKLKISPLVYSVLIPYYLYKAYAILQSQTIAHDGNIIVYYKTFF